MKDSDEFVPWDVRAARAETENQRLRAAIGHLMDDVERSSTHKDVSASMRTALRIIAARLKTALEKP